MDGQTPLDRALAAFAGKQRQLARAAGVSQSAISQAVSAGRVSAELAVKIEAATNGSVSRGDLRPDLWPANAGAAA